MRLLLVSPGWTDHIGGVETVVVALARGLVRRGVQVEVWAHATGVPTVTTTRDAGVLVRRFPTTRSARFPISVPLRRFARAHLGVGSYDVVHGHSYHSTAALALLAASAGLPVVFSPHYHGVGHTPLARVLHRPYRPFGDRLFARADRIVTVSDSERALVRRDVPGSDARTTTVHNGADVAAIQAALPYPGSRPVVLAAGRLETYKHVDDVIAACRGIDPAARLVVVGDGPDRGRLQRLADASGRDVEFRGRVGDDELRRWWRTARVVVSLSEHESFGLVALEAVAGGARVVLSDLPAHREVAGLLPGDRVALVAGVDAARRAVDAALAQPVTAPVAVRSWDDVVTDHLALYDELGRVRRVAAPPR